MMMFGVSSMILLTSLMSLQQIAHATPLITKFGSGYADGKHTAQDTFHSGVIYHSVWATIQDMMQPGLNFLQEVVDNEQINSNHVNNSDNGINECDSWYISS